MMLDYQVVIDLLNNIQSPSQANRVADDIDRRSDDPHFMTHLQHAIRDHQLQSNTKTAAVVVLSRLIKQKYSEWNQEYLVTCLMDVITDTRVEYRIKQSLEDNLTVVMEITTEYYFTQVLLKAAQILYMLPKTNGNSQFQLAVKELIPQQLKVALLILRSLLRSNAHFGLLSKSLIESLLQATLSVKMGLPVKELNAMIQLAKFWKEVITKAREEASFEHSQFVKQIARSQLLTQWVFQIYNLDSMVNTVCYINPQSPIDHQHLNELKSQVANLHSNILMAIERSRQTCVQELSSRHLSQVPFLINTVSVFSSHRSLCDPYSEFITNLLGVLILLLKQHHKHFSTIYDRLLHIIIFPLLAITDQQKQLFQDDPEQFNSLAQDCCDRQSFGILKTQAARMMEVLCDQVRASAEYTIQHAIISLKIGLAKEVNLESQAQHFLSLQESLFILSIMSYRLTKHQKQIYQLRKNFTVDNVISKSGPIELARCFQFLAYNYQQIYPQVTQGETWIYLALKTSLDQAERYPTLAFTSLDFISNVIQNYFSEQFALEYMQKAMRGTNDMKFKIFIKLISHHFNRFSEEGLCKALDCLLSAVVQDVIRYEKREKTHTMDINHSLNTLKRIVEHSQAFTSKNMLKSKVWEFIELLPKFKRINVDDQIIKIMISLIKLQGVTSKVQSILPQVLQIYKSQNFIQTPYIVFLNEIALRSSNPVQAGIFFPLLQSLDQLWYNVKGTPTSVTDNLALGSSLLIMQHIVAAFGEKIGEQLIRKVAQLMLRIIPQTDQPEYRIEPIVLARALNLMFLCHMHHKDERALRRMLNFRDAFLFRGHDLKVLTACLTKEIFRDTDIVAVTEMINLLVVAIWKINQQSMTPQIRSKKNPNLKKKSTVIRIKKVADYQNCLKLMMSPFNPNLIPQLQLSTTLHQMKSMNPLLYQGIIRSLPNQTEEQLRQLMSSVTIQGEKRIIVKTGQIKNNNGEIKMANNNIDSLKRKLEQKGQDYDLEDEEDQSVLSKKMQKKRRKEEEQARQK